MNAILRAGWAFSVADFVGQDEADIEDLFDPKLFVEIINTAFALKGKKKLDVTKLEAADSSTKRIVKKAEAAFRTMSQDTPNLTTLHQRNDC
jgi:hypothetical protein